MPTVPLERAQAELPELIRGLSPGEELVITDNGKSVGKLSAVPPPLIAPRVPGFWIGKVTVLAEDDEHLRDFEEHMS